VQLAKHASVLSETRYGFALNELAAWPETADSDRKSALTSRTFIMASLASSHCKYFVSGRPDASFQEFAIVSERLRQIDAWLHRRCLGLIRGAELSYSTHGIFRSAAMTFFSNRLITAVPNIGASTSGQRDREGWTVPLDCRQQRLDVLPIAAFSQGRAQSFQLVFVDQSLFEGDLFRTCDTEALSLL